MADDWWHREIGDAEMEAGRLCERVGSSEILPYFSGWVRRTRDRLAFQPGWQEWARRWSCRSQHVRAVMALEDNDREPTRSALIEDIGILQDIRRSPAPPPTDNTSPPQYSVFVSYCHGDLELAARIVNSFTFYLFDVWFDRTMIGLGDSLRLRIDQGMSRSRYGVLLITSTFLNRRWPRIELDGFMALAADANRRIVPICIGVAPGELPHDEPDLAAFLASQAIWTPATDGAVSALVPSLIQDLAR